MILYQDEHLTVSYSQDGEYIMTSWNGFTSLETFKAGIDRIMEFFYEKKARGLLIDTVQHKGVDPKGQHYAAEQLNKYMHDYFPVNQAVVVSKDVFARFSVKNFSKQLTATDKLFEQRFFQNDNEEAGNWLKESYKKSLIS